MDRALRGRGLLGVGKAKQPKRKGPREAMKQGQAREEIEKRDSLEDLGTYASGGIKGKPHSTKEGRRAAGANFLNRAWGQKHKKKGVEV